jgi:hypothetical protein
MLGETTTTMKEVEIGVGFLKCIENLDASISCHIEIVP